VDIQIISIIMAVVGGALTRNDLLPCLGFKVQKYKSTMATYSGAVSPPEETTEFSVWERRRKIIAWIGLFLIFLSAAISIFNLSAKY
jgi:hypothetical protein